MLRVHVLHPLRQHRATASQSSAHGTVFELPVSGRVPPVVSHLHQSLSDQTFVGLSHYVNVDSVLI